MRKKQAAKMLSIVLASCMIVPLSLSGCATQQSSSSPADQKATIHVLTRFSGADMDTPVFKDAISQFMKENPNVTIVDDSIADETAYNNKLKTDIATGDVPNIFYSPAVASLVPYAKNGIIMDVTPMMQDKSWYSGFVAGSFEEWNFSDYGVKGYYGIPFSGGLETFYYNKSLFKQAGIAQTPITMDDLTADIAKLKAADIVPWGVGAKDTWRFGHVLNNVLYKMAGIQEAKAIGARKAKWTDPAGVQALQYVKGLQKQGAFEPNFEDITFAQEEADFFAGKSAMMLNGVWFISDALQSKDLDNIGTFPFPYFADKPQYRYDAVSYPQGMQLSGKATGAEKDAEIAFMKFLTSKDEHAKFIKATQRVPVRSDIDMSSLDLSELFYGVVDIQKTVKNTAGDTFDFDPLSSMQDVTRNTLIGMCLDNSTASAQNAAQALQKEIDSNAS